MATLLPDQIVYFKRGEMEKLAYPPPCNAMLSIGVHPGALKARHLSSITQVVAFCDGQASWTAAVDEGQLECGDETMPESRQAITQGLFRGSRLWDVIDPGLLTVSTVMRPYKTIYDGGRPWIVIGELDVGELLAVPLNEPSNPKEYTPIVDRKALLFPNSKTSQIELPHLWSFPTASRRMGQVEPSARDKLRKKMEPWLV